MIDRKRTDWAGVFARHQSTLMGFFRRRIRHHWDAQDLTQEVYLRLLRADERELIRNPEGYLRTVAANLVREYIVLRRRAPQSMDTVESIESTETSASDFSQIDTRLPEEEVDRQLREAQLAKVLEQLPPKYRAVLIMQHRHGKSYEDIARDLHVSTHMVKKYVVKALALCRQALRE